MASSRGPSQSVNVETFTSLDPDSLIRVNTGTGTHKPHVVLYDTVSSAGEVGLGNVYSSCHLFKYLTGSESAVLKVDMWARLKSLT